MTTDNHDYYCGTCEAHALRDGDDLRPVDNVDLAHRIMPGDVYTDRKCFHCDSLVYPVPGQAGSRLYAAECTLFGLKADSPIEAASIFAAQVALGNVYVRVMLDDELHGSLDEAPSVYLPCGGE